MEVRCGWRVWVVMLLLLGAHDVRAEPNSAVQERVRAHFEAGRALAKIGRYDEALREFVTGYDLSSRPEFLVNIGQVYRKLGNLTKAREAYQEFLERQPHHPSARDVRAMIGELDAELASYPPSAPVEPRRPPPVSAPIEPAPTPRVEPTPAPRVEPAPALVVAAPARRGFSKKHLAWIVPLSAGVLAGVAVGIYFGVRSSSCDVPLGCFDLR